MRLRGLLTQAPLTTSQSLLGQFDPCAKCPDPPPCMEACPAGAFQRSLQMEEVQEDGDSLPLCTRSPRSSYDKAACRNYSMGHLKEIGPFTYLWCRACEESCPVGKSNLPSKSQF